MDRIHHEGKWHHLSREGVTTLKRYRSHSSLAVINSKMGKSTIVLQSLCCAFFIQHVKQCHFFYRRKYLTSQYLNRQATKSSVAAPVRNATGRGMSTLLNWAVSYASFWVFHFTLYLCLSPVLHNHADNADFANTAWLRESTKYLKKIFRERHRLWVNLPTPRDTSLPAMQMSGGGKVLGSISLATQVREDI